MVNLIHTLKKNDVKIAGKDFICDIGFMNEVLKSLLFRQLGYNHPLSDLIPYIIMPTRTKDKKTKAAAKKPRGGGGKNEKKKGKGGKKKKK